MIDKYWLSKMIKLRVIGEIEDDVIDAIRDVMLKMPERDALILLQERNVHFYIPVLDRANRVLMSSKVRNKPLQLPDGQYNVDAEFWLVCLAPELLNAPRHQFVYKLAHELAHIYFRHGSLEHLRASDPEDGCDDELDADLRVVEWGFEQEFSLCPDTYLQDSPLLGLRRAAAGN